MSKQLRLGKVQLQIMQVLWDRKKATARDITDELSKSEPIAHSTVQTLLRKLEVKGAVNHMMEGRTFVFLPAVEQAAVTQTAAHDLFTRVFHGSLSGLVAHLIESENIPQEELKALRELIDTQTGGEGK